MSKPTDTHKDETAVRHTITLPLSPEHAFSTFSTKIGTWWPVDNTFAGIQGAADQLDDIIIEPRAGGHWYEQNIQGKKSIWGSVQQWEPPRRIVLTWQITAEGQPEPDPQKASEVEIRFIPEDASNTRIELEHRAFGRHGAKSGAIWRAGMESDQGWTKLLAHYAKAAVKNP